MSEPLALLSLALAAGGGTVDTTEAQQWIAAGHALLARSPALLRALGSGRAAILLPPCGAFLTALASSDGRGVVLINPLASAPEILRQIDDANVSAVFTNEALAPRIEARVPMVLLDGTPYSAQTIIDGVVKTVDLGSQFALSLTGRTDVDGRDEEAVIVYTSAMAGKPLGAILTHRGLLANAHASIDALGDSREDHCLAALPLAHLFGLVVAAASPLLCGAKVTLMPHFHPVRALELMQSGGITRFMGVPSMFSALLQVLERSGERTFRNHNLRLCLVGGAPVPVELQDAWFNATGSELRQGYGLTEASPACLLSRADSPNRRGTMGIAVPGTEVAIRDRNSDEFLADEIEGEICVRGPHVFRGYVSGGSDGLQVKDEWLRTGDLGVRHPDGTVSFRGLIKAMFTRNGFNIYPREIEAAIQRMPGVESVRAAAVPHPTRENDVAIAVTGSVAESDVRRWAERELAAYKVPTHISVTR